MFALCGFLLFYNKKVKKSESHMQCFGITPHSVLAALGCSEWVTGTGALLFLLAPRPSAVRDDREGRKMAGWRTIIT